MSWSASRTALGVLAALLLAALGGMPARAAGPVDEGLACLAASRLDCAREALAEAGDLPDDDPGRLLLEARLAFHEGRFADAVARMDRLAELDPERFAEETEAGRERALVAATARAAEGLVETRRDGVVVLHHPGVDRILVDDVVETLAIARQRVAPLLGGAPGFPVRVEFYPDSVRFTAATGLPEEAVRDNGVVAISKWNRLLLISPRAMVRGYAWRDTLVHEWIHLVVSWRTWERTPVWLQEGIARNLDLRWRQDDFALTPAQQSLLAQAIAKDDFVTFEEMHPSFALLPGPDRAALAYAQVATLVERLRERAGPRALLDLLGRLADGEDAQAAFAEVAGMPSFDAVLDDWRGWLETLPLLQERLSVLPNALAGEGEEYDVDPLLARHRELADRARLGDLMAERGHHEAALRYYDEAMPEDEPPGPVLVEHRARALVALGRRDEAMRALEASVAVYPEYPGTHRLLAGLLRGAGRTREALAHYRAAADIDPYVIEVQQALAELYAAVGDPARAARHRAARDVLAWR